MKAVTMTEKSILHSAYSLGNIIYSLTTIIYVSLKRNTIKLL